MKHKVLIVDDDQNFRYAIRETIPWEKNGFVVAGEAIHGRQALKLMEEQEYDIVLTDMEMPIMNGVELTREIKSRYPDQIILAMSAYDDFSFVKESMRLGAADYILKQEFDPDEIIRLISNLYKQRENEIGRERSNNLIFHYIRGEVTGTTAENMPHLFSEDERLVVFVVECEADDMQLAKEVHPAGLRVRYYFRYAPFRWLFICNAPEALNQKRKLEKYRQAANEISDCFVHSLAIGMSDGESDSKGLPVLFSQAQTALDYYMYYPHRHLFFYADFRADEAAREPEFRYIPEGGYTDAGQLSENFENMMTAHKPDRDNLNHNMMVLIKEFLVNNEISISEPMMINYYEALSKHRTLEDKLSLFRETAEAAKENDGNEYKGSHMEVRRALRFIEEHYQEEITLAQLSAVTGLSENYFSNLFKKEMDVNLKAYLNQVRIRKAKQLLRNTDLLVYEVADKVGYRNATYFTTMFKRMTGISVSEYKRQSVNR